MILLFRMGDNDEWSTKPSGRTGRGLVLTPTRVFTPTMRPRFTPTIQPRPPKTPHPSTLRREATPPPPPPLQNSSINEGFGFVMPPRRPRPQELKKNNVLEQRRLQKRQEFDALVEENHDLRTNLGMSDSNEELGALLALEENPAGTREEIIKGRMHVFEALKMENKKLNAALVKKGRGFTVGNAKRGLLALGAAGLSAGLASRYLTPGARVETSSLADPFGSYAGSTLHAAPPPAPVTLSTMLPTGWLEEARAEEKARVEEKARAEEKTINELNPTPTETPVPPRSGIQGLLYRLYEKFKGGRKGTKRRRISKRRRSSTRRR